MHAHLALWKYLLEEKNILKWHWWILDHKINIIPEEIAIKASFISRKLNMNLRGIGGHTTSLVGLLEFTPITMITGEQKEIHLFIEKGAVHTIPGRPFLADNNVKLEFSLNKWEIFSYPEQDGR
ncbi:hypothetical protein O181_023779 [Austropuccinia psidii MF-1]|uniref:Uncharacterized protein n=1 Tax=Austropuccinia psidii MF-1 TaxID=1389203 RepID=A0A9Q3CF23_9BASI|nr:hypothetical protein [Austropuccinia psidii MF-1]